MLNAQELTHKIVADWFVNGAKPSDTKITAKDVENKLAEFKQVTRALGLPAQFTWDDALEASELIADRVNSLIDAANDYDLG